MMEEDDLDRLEKHLNICIKLSDLFDEENVLSDVEYLNVFAAFMAIGIKNEFISIEDIEGMINLTADIVQILYQAEDSKLEDQT